VPETNTPNECVFMIFETIFAFSKENYDVRASLSDSRTATGGRTMGSFDWRPARQQTNYLVARPAKFDFASQSSTARLQKIESRPEKSAASRSAETAMSDIMYLPMRNGLANGFSSPSVIDPTAGMRFEL